MIAFNDDTENADALIKVVAWDRAHYTWKAPITIDAVKAQHPSYPEVSIAYDPSTSRFGLAYSSYPEGKLWVAYSTDGAATWTKQQAFPTGTNPPP